MQYFLTEEVKKKWKNQHQTHDAVGDSRTDYKSIRETLLSEKR